MGNWIDCWFWRFFMIMITYLFTRQNLTIPNALLLFFILLLFIVSRILQYKIRFYIYFRNFIHVFLFLYLILQLVLPNRKNERKSSSNNKQQSVHYVCLWCLLLSLFLSATDIPTVFSTDKLTVHVFIESFFWNKSWHWH